MRYCLDWNKAIAVGTVRSLLVGCVLLFAHAVHAEEIATNGLGGGLWSDPATWRGKKVPTGADDVVIQKNDVVVFDRSDDGKPSCKKLLLDPKGGLTFKTGVGKLVCTVQEGIESFGVLRMDGTKSASDELELRLIGDAPAKRIVKLNKGAALLLYGKANLPDEKRNVRLVSARTDKEPILGVVEAEEMVMIDWQRALIHDVKLVAKKLDNTGAKPNERIKLIENQFTGVARVMCQYCDTPEIVKNTFTCDAPKPLEEAAINVSYSPLSEIKNNLVNGGFAIGISLTQQSDPVLIGNTIEKCATGIQGHAAPNLMIKGTILRDCPIGIKVEAASGVLEDTTIEGATMAFNQQTSTLQLTHFVVKFLDKKGLAIFHESGKLTLHNTNVTPDQIKVVPQTAEAGKPPPVPLEHWQFVIVSVKDAPAGSLVELRTVGAAAGLPDPNVRNSPSAVVEGLTPLPATLLPLMVKSASVNLDGKQVPAPEYLLKILGPSPKEGADRPLLKTVPFRPVETLFRANPNDPTPSVEVSAK